MNLSFHEKSLRLTFATVAAAFALYFALVLPHASWSGIVGPGEVALFVAVVLALVVLQVAGFVMIAIADRRTRTDERDRLVALKGSRNGGFVLACGVFVALCLAVAYPASNFAFTHVLLAFWVAAQLVDTGTQIVLQRTGV